MKFIAIHENLVSDDIIIQHIKANTLEEADAAAYKYSDAHNYISTGNYDLYILDFDAEKLFTGREPGVL